MLLMEHSNKTIMAIKKGQAQSPNSPFPPYEAIRGVDV
jgi:hypothetical protein